MMHQFLHNFANHYRSFLLKSISVFLLAIFCFSFIAPLAPAHANPNDRPRTMSNFLHPIEPPPEREQEFEGYFFFREGNTTKITHPTDTQAEINRAFTDHLCQEGYLTEKIVRCIQGAIRTAVGAVLTGFSATLNAAIFAVIILAVSIFGAKVLAGTAQRPGPEALTLGIKIGAVLLFTNGALGGFLDSVFPVMESLAGYAMSYISDSNESVFLASCSTYGGDLASIWAKVDCILKRLFTGGDIGGGAGVLWILAVAIFWTNLLGVLLFFVMFTVFVTIFLLVLRCVYVFLSCYAFLGLLTIISPLMIPLILFERTMPYFQKWLKQFIGMIVQPMVLFAFMTFFFAVLDSVFFQDNDYSLSSIMGVNWENPGRGPAVGNADIDSLMDAFEEDTNFRDGDEEWQAYRRYLQSEPAITEVGGLHLNEEYLINIDLEIVGDAINNTFIGDIPGATNIANFADTVINWLADKVGQKLLPFKVVRVNQEHMFMDLLKFFVVVLVLLPLMVKFAQDIPRLIQQLSQAIRPPASTMPVERQALGVIGAAKGAAKGAVKGAVKGFVRGGPKGAATGAKVGAVRGGISGYRNAAGGGGGSRGSTSHSGSAHADNVHAKEGKGGADVMAKTKNGAIGRAKNFGVEKMKNKVATKAVGGGGGGGGGAAAKE